MALPFLILLLGGRCCFLKLRKLRVVPDGVFNACFLLSAFILGLLLLLLLIDFRLGLFFNNRAFVVFNINGSLFSFLTLSSRGGPGIFLLLCIFRCLFLFRWLRNHDFLR